MKKGGVDYMSSALYWINEVVKKIKSIDWGTTKLARILNEYEDEKELVCGKRNYKWHYDEENDSIYAERIDGSELGEEESWAVIICRGYCFIWRLVENNKIDFEDNEIKTKINGLMSLAWNWSSSEWMTIGEYKKLLYKEWLLMVLSIDDSPIHLLSSLLN